MNILIIILTLYIFYKYIKGFNEISCSIIKNNIIISFTISVCAYVILSIMAYKYGQIPLLILLNLLQKIVYELLSNNSYTNKRIKRTIIIEYFIAISVIVLFIIK